MKHNSSIAIILIALILIASPFPVFGQTAVGKLTGKVVDLETGEPLIGANVLVDELQTGAATNVEGIYTILNLSPGTYTVRISYVGYQPQVITEVRVVAGITKELDVRMRATTVDVGEVVIVADRPLFEAKATNTVKVYDSRDIAQLPVRSVQRVVSVQAGVVSAEGSGGVDGNAAINIRGGRSNEVLYIVDGVPQNDILFGANRAQVSDNAIEQVAFQVGGYEAKYGQAQSGIINITTKTGGARYSVLGEVVTSTLTDDYGYNLYTLNLSGPIIPDDPKHTLFLSGERGWFLDATPSAVGINITTPALPDFRGEVIRGGRPLQSKSLPDNTADVWRFTGRTYHNLDFMTARIGGNVNIRNSREYVHDYAKNNSHHNPRVEEQNQSYTLRLSRNFDVNTYLNVNFGTTDQVRERGDGVWFDNIWAYGDPNLNNEISSPGTFPGRDRVGVFSGKGELERLSTFYRKQRIESWTIDADFFSQWQNHLFEVGGGLWLHRLRLITIFPRSMPTGLGFLERVRRVRPIAYGFYYDDKEGSLKRTAKDEVDPASGEKVGPRYPTIGYAYIQDRFELEDIVLNLGARLDYFDPKNDVLKDESLPFAHGDPTKYDAEDFVVSKAEVFVSPRIGLGFPVTPTTVFHAQWGRFIQMPRLVDVYTSINDLIDLTVDQNLNVITGHVKPEKTTQYEVGFRQILGDNQAAINLTAFYKNTEDLTNTTTRFYQRQVGGATFRYYGPSNFDFGTVKGLAFTFDIRRISYFWASLNYTLSFAEGTGSSTTSSLIATFRNDNGEVPIVIAPLDFDQRHTGTVNVGFVTGKGELGMLQNVSVSALGSFNSGRPYTPLQQQNLLAGSSNYGDTRGYVNSTYGPGGFLLNLKAEKTFFVEKFSITPYVWIENVLDSDNPVVVYRSTGNPYTTEWINTPDGVAASNSSPLGPDAYRADNKAFEVNPANFGIPRQIRLGLRVNFDQ